MESGYLLVITDTVFKHVNRFVIDKVGSNNFTVANINNPYQRLCIENEQIIYRSGPPGRNNIITIEPVEDSDAFRLGILKNKDKDCKTYTYLAVNENGQLSATSSLNNSKSTSFMLSFFPGSDLSQLDGLVSASKTPVQPFYPFKHWQMRRFLTEGFIQLSNIVKKDKITECIRYLNHYLGKPGEIVAGGVQGQEQLGKFAGHVSNCAAVRDLFKDEVENVINSLMGQHGYENANLSAQIAFRFPELQNELPLTEDNLEEIENNVAWHTDGLRQGKAHGFSLLLGIVLSDIQEEFSGNLMVWPGSHLLLHSCKTTEFGALDEDKVKSRLLQQKYTDLRSKVGDKKVKHAAQILTTTVGGNSNNTENQVHENEPELPALGSPIQIIARAGDIVILHPDLAHAGGPNYSSEIRKMVYFRIKASTAASINNVVRSDKNTFVPGISTKSTELPTKFVNWEDVVSQHQQDMWCDIPGVRKVLGEDEVNYMMQYFVNEA